MEFNTDWQRLLRHAWSIRWLTLSALLSGLEAALPLFDILLPVSPEILAAINALVVTAALLSRLIRQKEFKNGTE